MSNANNSRDDEFLDVELENEREWDDSERYEELDDEEWGDPRGCGGCRAGSYCDCRGW